MPTETLNRNDMAKTDKRKDLMRITEAARVLGVSRSTVMYRIAQGRYGSETVAGLTFAKRQDVERDAPAKVAA